ncbi:MAG: type II secretion system protein [Candidatus Taylorbacteria bacterium]|nr:type II secretion system protein [Candidatus Taylorbacteria bacterium]
MSEVLQNILQKKRGAGFSIIEIVIGAAIVALVVTAIASAWQFYVKLGGQSTRTTQAALLIEEGGEALQYLRDKGWASNIGNLATNTTYYLIWNGTDYVTTATPTLINNNYSRTVILSAVLRDASDNIATTGTADPNTRTATLSIYPNLDTTTPILQAQMLIHNVFQN